LNYDDATIDTLYEFENPLLRQPEFFQMNHKQDVMVISSQEDGIYKDMRNGTEIDLDEKFNIGIIKEIIHDDEDECFYLVANKYDEKLGFFIVRMSDSDPIGDFKFLTKYKNKLDIGDCKLFVMRSGEG
tara:strand:+ start:1872 stop:2258 length:387 start_codon:yes stop_codon:yes gene_type:complete